MARANRLDSVEREYLLAIREADTDEAYWLSVGLDEYRRFYKSEES